METTDAINSINAAIVRIQAADAAIVATYGVGANSGVANGVAFILDDALADLRAAVAYIESAPRDQL
jgi:hypothetical protein